MANVRVLLAAALLASGLPLTASADEPALRLHRGPLDAPPERGVLQPPPVSRPALAPRAARELSPRGGTTPATAAPVVGEVYVDRVLDTSPTLTRGPPADGPAPTPLPLGPGRSVTSVEVHTQTQRQGGETTQEQGALLRWSRETLDWGLLSAEVGGRLEDGGGRLSGGHGSGRFTLRQEGFALGGTFLSDVELGDQIARANPLLSRSFRFNLPSSFMRGAGITVYDARQELRVQVGRVGDLAGERLLTYEADDETLGGIGYARDLGERLSVAAQVWSLTGTANGQDHASAAGALRWQARPAHGVELRTLADTQGRLGVWLDGDVQGTAWRHRYGLFRIAPQLRWLDDPIANDREGAYWRSELRATRYSFTAGLDVSETNLDADPARAGSVLASAFMRGTWLARRGTQLGATLDLRARRDGRGADVAEQDRAALTLFTSHRTSLGVTRVQGFTAFTRGEDVDQDRYELSLDHGWPVSAAAGLDTRLRLARERGSEGARDEVELGVLMRRELGPGVSLVGDGSAVRVLEAGRDTRSLGLNLRVDWAITPGWRLDLGQQLTLVRGSGAGRRESRVDYELFARLRWSEASGERARVLGVAGPTPGTGRIVGVVFFDDNRDGRRSPGEEVAANALVQLDGRRATTRTDADGRFEFWPVYAGPHEVTLRVEELPLPWGLADEAPQAVDVGPRETVRVEFPLVRLGE